MLGNQQKIRVGIDGRYQGGPLTGVPRYIDEICAQLDVLMPQADFFIYAQRPEGVRLPSARWELRTESSPLWANTKPNLWLKYRAGRMIQEDRLDVFWAAAGLLAGFAGRVPQVLTVYDFTFRLYPETMSRANLWAHRLFFAGDLRRASRVIAISDGTSRRMREFYGRAADAIVRPDAAERFRPASAAECEDVRRRYGLAAPFVLAVSTLEPRKNFTALIDAFLRLKRTGQLPSHELVLIGRKGWRDTRLAEQIAEQEGRSIRSLGFVQDEDLPALYSACDVFCMPSLYEGFGIPVLEARRCGARVVATNIEELREAGGTWATYCQPTPEGIAQSLLETLNRRPIRQTSDDYHCGNWSASASILAKHLNI